MKQNSETKIHKVVYAPQLHLRFAEAVLLTPPGDQARPPDVTLAGKSVGKLYLRIASELWDQIKFRSPDGKPIRYIATIKTEIGEMTLELWPEVAPNHVRSFIALARAGYYNGLQFDRAARIVLDVGAENGMNAVLPGDVKEEKIHEFIEAGCPLGTGEAQYGSIGYWLKPEISDKVTHAPGVISAVHGRDINTAACKFFITLNEAKWLDGSFTIFGKITQGLDVARKIFNRPKVEGLPDRPERPVRINEIVIRTH